MNNILRHSFGVFTFNTYLSLFSLSFILIFCKDPVCSARYIKAPCCGLMLHNEKKMMHTKNIFWLFLLISIAVLDHASPLTNGNTCTPSSAGNPSIDDAPAIREALSTCGNGGTIIIPAGKTFTIRTTLDFVNCNGCDFQIEGTLKVADDDLGYWEGRLAFFLLSNVTRATFHSLTGSGLIDGSGQKFWDYFAGNQSYRRPFLVYFNNASDVIFTKLRVINSPFWFFYVMGNSTNIKFTEMVLTAVTTTEHRPANTDGFDTGECSHVTISNNYVRNGDDCVSFKNGSNYITVTNITCIGSHGLSVGSLGGPRGYPNIVTNVYVSDAKMINSSLGTRIKFYPGGPAHAPVYISNVTYKDIIMENIDYALQVDNCYESNTTECKMYPSAAQIFDIRFFNITGTTSTTHDPVVAKIECPPNGTCDLKFTDWNVVSPSGKSTVLCSHYDHPSGITCTPGDF